MRLTIAVLLLVAGGSALAAPLAFCAKAKFRETVAEYWADNRLPSLAGRAAQPDEITSIYGLPSFSHAEILALSPSEEACLKIAIDANLHVCRARAAERDPDVRRGLKPPRVTPDGTPQGVASAMRQKAVHVGGEAQKQRNIDAAWRTHNRKQAAYERALQVRRAAVMEAHGLARAYESKGCTNAAMWSEAHRGGGDRYWDFVPTALKDEIAPPKR